MNPGLGIEEKAAKQIEFDCCFNSICSSKGQCCLSTPGSEDKNEADEKPRCVLKDIVVDNESKPARCFGSLCDQCEDSNKCLFNEVLTIPKFDFEFVGIKTETIEVPASPECCMFIQQEDSIFNKAFDCSRCEYKTDIKRNLQRHLLTHSEARLFQCTVCEYKATQKHHLQQHMFTHSNKQVSSCSDCEYSCKFEGVPLQQAVSTALQTHKPYVCVECDYRATTKHHLQQHVASHANEKIFKCTFCDYTTTRRFNLQQHIPIHDVEKPFRCSECDYSSTRKYHLQNHMTVHTGEKPFQCTECDYKTAVKRSLQLHTLTHNGKQPLECSKCRYKCSTKVSLTKHMKAHCVAVPCRFDY